LVWRIIDLIGTSAAHSVVAPDVEQVQPMSHLVRRGAAQVEGRLGGAAGPEGR
jgi:hypothetical protein